METDQEENQEVLTYRISTYNNEDLYAHLFPMKNNANGNITERPISVKLLGIFYILCIFPLAYLSLIIIVLSMFHGPIILFLTGFILISLGLTIACALGIIFRKEIIIDRRKKIIIISPIFIALIGFMLYNLYGAVQYVSSYQYDSQFAKNVDSMNKSIKSILANMKNNSPEIVSYTCGNGGKQKFIESCYTIQIHTNLEKEYLTTFLEQEKDSITQIDSLSRVGTSPFGRSLSIFYKTGNEQYPYINISCYYSFDENISSLSPDMIKILLSKESFLYCNK